MQRSHKLHALVNHIAWRTGQIDERLWSGTMLGRWESVKARWKSQTKRLSFEALEGRVVLSGTTINPPAPESTMVVATSGPIAASVLDLVVPSLTFERFGELTAAQAPLLSLQQVASIPTVYWLQQMSAAARSTLNFQQVQAIQPAALGLNLLTPLQRDWLTTTQIRGLNFWDFPLLYPTQTGQLSAAQVATIPNTDAFDDWSSAARFALTSEQVIALRIGDISVSLLNAAQIGWLSAGQFQSLPFFDFVHLRPSQIPLLTAAQIATIPNVGAFQYWAPASRAALTEPQVQALPNATLDLSLLTEQQRAWLTPAQVRSLPYWEFPRLPSSQILHLSTTQIGTIPGTDAFSAWSPIARASMTDVQVQALRVDRINLGLLNAAQIGWLTAGQIQSLPFFDFVHLRPSQIQYLTTAQIATIPNIGAFAQWVPASRAALTPTQIQALPNATLDLSLLPEQHRAWLTPAQVRSLPYWEFPRLPSSQILHLSTAQIATIPGSDAFSAWTPIARVSMTEVQVQALRADRINLSLLNAAEIGWLTAGQIQSLPFFDFVHLRPSQIPYLTTAQVQSVPGDYAFRSWAPVARAALSQSQIQVLQMPQSRIDWMTSQQVSWLTSAQLWSLAYYDLPYLSPAQIPSVSPGQFASIPSANLLNSMSDLQLAALTRPQLLHLASSVYAGYVHLRPGIAPPNYVDQGNHIHEAPDGLHSTEQSDAEWAKVLALVPLQQAAYVTVGSGDWTDPSIWRGGAVPTAGANVLIAAGTTVRFDAFMSGYSIDTLRIDGALNFADNIGTQLKVDTVVVNYGGALRIGTEAAPIRNDVIARILVADNGPIDTVKDPYLFSRGILSRGEVRMHGMEVTPYVNLAVNPTAGSTQLVLSQPPVNWRVGDELVVAGVDPYVADFRTERVFIRAISGTTVTIDPLQYDHVPPAGYGLSIQAANLNRNIRLMAEDASVNAERPHMALMHNPNIVLTNIGTFGFGRTDKGFQINDAVVVNGVLQPGTGLNQRARYAIHFHHAGVNPDVAPAVVRGSVVVDSAGWGYVNHQSNVVMENNVAFDVVGAGFVTEDGNEIGAMRHNLALMSMGSSNHEDREELHDFGFAGNGFWFQGPGVEVVDNISAGSQGGGFHYVTGSSKALFDAINLSDITLAGGRDAVPVSSIPLNTFYGNTAYAAGEGLSIWKSMLFMPDGQSTIDRFTSWNTREAGISVNYSGHIHVKDALLVGDLANFVGVGIATDRQSHDVILTNNRIEGFAVGIEAAAKRNTEINGGYIAAVQGVSIEKGHDTIRSVLIRDPVFAELTPTQLKGRQQYYIYTTAVTRGLFVDRKSESYLSSDLILIESPNGSSSRLYFYEQNGLFAPFPSVTYTGYLPSQYLNKTNVQLQLEFGRSFGGELVPSDAAQLPRIHALVKFGV